MQLKVEPYLQQEQNWPPRGKVILAQYDADSIVVYQAYRPAIGHFAAEHGYFGGEFKLSRMTWIKPNFLWMMYRSGWGQKEGQEVTLAIRVARSAFDSLLSQAVHAKHIPSYTQTQIQPTESLNSRSAAVTRVRRIGTFSKRYNIGKTMGAPIMPKSVPFEQVLEQHLKTPDRAMSYLKSAFEENDPDLFQAALEDVISAQGQTFPTPPIPKLIESLQRHGVGEATIAAVVADINAAAVDAA